MRKLFLALVLLATPIHAATRYISPTGSDDNGPACNTGTPCQHFSYVIGLMVAGDTLILKNGTYTSATTGLINISSKSGTALAYLTIKAENERQAFISGAGSVPVQVNSSSYWSIEGLYVSNADVLSGAGQGNVMLLQTVSYITIKRCLLYHNNRYYNGAILAINTGDHCLVEENEAYFYHRNGIGGGPITYSTFRRNYANGRSAADISGGYVSGCSSTADSGIIIYPGSYNIFENNIAENTCAGIDNEADYGNSVGNQYLGHMSIGNVGGMYLRARTATTQMPTNSIVKDFVAIGSTSLGAYFRGNRNTQASNMTVLSGTGVGGIAIDYATSEPGVAPRSVFLTNVISSGNVGYGFYETLMESWGYNYVTSYGNSGTDSPAFTNANITNELVAPNNNPSLGSCIAWIPVTSTNVKGKGLNNSDIGANVLYQYASGVLTSTPLWRTSSGTDSNGAAYTANDFTGCGVVVAGINDVAGSSCRDVDVRLHVGSANGCTFPTGYGGVSTSGGNWLATDNFDTTQTNGSGYVVGADLSTLNGGPGWTGPWTQGIAAITIAQAPAGNQSQGGNAAFINADASFSYSRTFVNLSAGLVSWLFRINTTTPGDAVYFILDEGTSGTAARGMITLDTDGFVKIFDYTNLLRVNLGPYSPDTWYKVTVEFDSANQPNRFRAKLNAGVFSQWYTAANGGVYTVINRFRVETASGTFAGQLYFDDIKEGNASSLISTIDVIDSNLASQGLYIGTNKALGWSSTDLTGNIDLRLTRNAGLTYENLALGVPNTGTYNWIVDGPACTQCRVRMCSSSTPTLCDDSAIFRIFGANLR